MWTEFHQQINEQGTWTGRLLVTITASMLFVAESMPKYMAISQVLAWIGTFIAGACTGVYYLHKMYLNHKNGKLNKEDI